MKDLKDIKEGVSFLWHALPITEAILKIRSSINRVTTNDWVQLASSVLENSPQLHGKSY